MTTMSPKASILTRGMQKVGVLTRVPSKNHLVINSRALQQDLHRAPDQIGSGSVEGLQNQPDTSQVSRQIGTVKMVAIITLGMPPNR